jgi:hypothetical protein
MQVWFAGVGQYLVNAPAGHHVAREKQLQMLLSFHRLSPPVYVTMLAVVCCDKT